MTNAIRDDRVDPEYLDNLLFVTGRAIENRRSRGREQLRIWDARTVCRDESTYLTRRYTSGVPVRELADTLDGWAEVFAAAVQSREDSPDGTPGSIAEIEDRLLLCATADLALAATSLGRADIATSILEHPAVAASPARIFDALAVIHGVSRPVSERDRLSSIFGPWLKVGNAAADRRQEAFERYVSGWRKHAEKPRALHPVDETFTGAWSFEAVVLAQVFGLDDGPVRDVPEYPVALADYARKARLPRLSTDVQLPGPWKKPPKAIQQKATAAAVAVSGEPTRSDLAALLTPVGDEVSEASTIEELLDVAVEAGTVVVVDWTGAEPAETGALLQIACKRLGIPVPSQTPGTVPTSFEMALVRFDSWLEPVGVRLVDVDVGADQVLVAPVLAANHETFAGRVIDGYRVRSMEQLAADQA
ncbi:PoNe immunity protein domain-containing protein [Microbacterium sp.]|uniref:PoNe immunity protein domain-containing protein n=1 Tax=Microbacterium sp. TaxID=51671 RepID=UPI003F9D3F73